MQDSATPADLPPPFVPPPPEPQPPASEPTPPVLTPSRPVYDGRLGELYGIYLRHLLLMLLTLGWSRFWGRTRLRRYLWNHLEVFGDRFEYRGRGLELLIGFVVVLAILGLWAGGVWSIWHFAMHERSLPGFGIFDLFFLSLAVIGVPLSFVGHYSGLRYKLSRTSWRGVRGTMAGSAWSYGAIATFLTLVNAFTARLMTPVVSVNLARPRICHARIGTQGFEFAGRAGDIYGRYIGYYFLNLVVWIVVVLIVAFSFGGLIAAWGVGQNDLKALANLGTLRTLLLIAGVLVALYLVFGLMILPLRCWWQAYLFRYLVSHTKSGHVLFATSISTRHMWGFLVLNYLIVLLSFGLGWPWVMHRTLRLIAGQLWLYGEPDGSKIGQPPERPPRFGEGLLDFFDVTGI